MAAKRINYIILILVVGFGLLFYHNYAMFMIFVMLFLLPVISAILARITNRKMSCELVLDKKQIGKNVLVNVSIKVHNPFIYPIDHLTIKAKIYNPFFVNEEEYQIVVPASPRSTRVVTLPVSGIYCGRMVVSLLSWEYGDIFGITSFRKELNQSGEFVIMPESVITLPQINLSQNGVAVDDEVQYVKGDDVSQISLIRDYIPGDKLQNIHWKLSAKKEELQVKEYSKPFSDEVTLLVELSWTGDLPETIDKVIEVFYAAGRFLLKKGRRFRVAWYNTKADDLFEARVQTDEELDAILFELYYMDLYVENSQMAYEQYLAIHSEPTTTIMYVAGCHVKDIAGEIVDIGEERVVLRCLSN